MLTIDGSQGEGGGQILRSSLALSMLTGTPFTLENVRAKRSKPGLRKQHLVALQAAAKICDAVVQGDAVGSKRVEFHPGSVRSGEYKFDIGTAGSTTLVLQTILPVLLVADGPSQFELIGGTHNPHAPPLEFLQRTYLPCVQQMGPQVDVSMEQHGFYPAGGGRLNVRVQPCPKLGRFELTERGKIQSRTVDAVVANLPLHIAERERDTFVRLAGWPRKGCEAREVPANGPGNVLLATVECKHVTEVFVGCGQQGVPAERVARQLWREAKTYLEADYPVGEYLADQLLLPLGMSAATGDGGSFVTGPLSLHSQTHIAVLQAFLEGLQVDLKEDDQRVTVCVGGGHESPVVAVPR